jgi:hypothetical protein
LVVSKSLQFKRRLPIGVQEERWRGGERKGSAWVNRDDVIEEDEEDDDDDNSEDEENVVVTSPTTTNNNNERTACESAAEVDHRSNDRLQVWRCRRQGRLERNFELDASGGGILSLPAGGGGVSLSVPPLTADKERGEEGP